MVLMPWPKPEPQPAPGEDSLFESVDWMTFTHEQLYAMVHQGVDLAGANAVAAKWAQLGDAMQEIGDQLAQALAASAEAWEGEAAEQARGSIGALSLWAQEAASTATEVSGCVSIEANNAEIARRNMPEPVAAMRIATPIPQGGTSPMSAAFSSARSLVRDPHGPSASQQEAHEEAARVMEQFQNASQEVYGTVPQFSPPSVRQSLNVSHEPLPAPPPAPPVSQPVPQPPVPLPAQNPGVAERPPAGSSSPVPQRPGVAPPPSGPAPSPSPAEVDAKPPVTPAESRPVARPAAASAASPGMSPAAMGGGVGPKEDQERKAPKYLQGETDIWGIADRLAPKVIGDDDGA
jgi:hypothetical protein